MNASFGLTIDSYCMTTALYILILVILELVFDRRNNKIVKGICLSISALITRFLPVKLHDYWVYGVTAVGLSYKLSEGALL